MRTTILILLLATAVTLRAGGLSAKEEQAWAQVTALALESESIEIYEGPPRGILLEITGKENIRQFMAQFRFTAKPPSGYFEDDDGKKVELEYYCQCLGEVCFSFRDKAGETTLYMEFCHREHLWISKSKVPLEETQFWLEPKCASNFAERMMAVFPELEKRWSNKTLVPTAPSGRGTP